MKASGAMRGQILIPALAIYLCLLSGFFAMVHWGRGVLTQMRMEMAAEAAALSAARAQAEGLNKMAMHNLLVNGFINISFNGYGGMQKSARDAFRIWLMAERTYLPRVKGYCASVGQRVAQMNGADRGAVYWPRPVNFRLEAKDMKVILFHGSKPTGAELFRQVYYARRWDLDKRRAQPPHWTGWMAAKGPFKAVAKARVYLDQAPGAPLHNGGFPRAHEAGWGALGIQSFYPQFNARLVNAPRNLERLLEFLHGP